MPIFSPYSLLLSDPLFFWPTHPCTHTFAQTHILVEYANSFMVCFHLKAPFYPRNMKWLNQHFCGLSCHPHPQTGEGSSTADKLQSLALLTLHTNLSASHPLFCLLETIFKKRILCTACFPLFWIYPHVSPPPRIHKRKVVVQRVLYSALSGVASRSRTGLVIHVNQTLSNDHSVRHTLGLLLELLPLVMELPRPVAWHWFFSGSHFPSIGSQGKSREPK